MAAAARSRGRFLEVAAHELDTDGQAVGGLSAGDADAAETGEAGGDRIDVREVHGEGIVGLFAELEGRGGGHGTDEDVDLREGDEEVLGEQGADLLRLTVVGVVVPGREGVGAEQDAALDLSAEAFVARLADTSC